jgi:large subunit ribosomal protein L20
MVRATCAPASRRRRKRILKQAKGFWGDRKNHIRQSANAVMSALSFNYRHRKNKKSDFRSLWITRIGIGAKVNGISYSKFMCGLKKAGCNLNRKMLAEMVIHDPTSFKAVVDLAKNALVQ